MCERMLSTQRKNGSEWDEWFCFTTRFENLRFFILIFFLTSSFFFCKYFVPFGSVHMNLLRETKIAGDSSFVIPRLGPHFSEKWAVEDGKSIASKSKKQKDAWCVVSHVCLC
jgi:hypothetical protein